MQALLTTRVHMIDGDRFHWAISVDKAKGCPTCAAPNGQLCAGLSKHSVHVARVRSHGHDVR